MRYLNATKLARRLRRDRGHPYRRATTRVHYHNRMSPQRHPQSMNRNNSCHSVLLIITITTPATIPATPATVFNQPLHDLD